MPEQPAQPLPVSNAANLAPKVVYYSRHLWRTANDDTWGFIIREKKTVIISAGVTFLVATLLILLLLQAESVGQYFLCVLVGLLAVALAYAGFLAAHLCYLTPRKLLARKQVQVDLLRDHLNARNAEVTTLKRSLAMKTIEKRESAGGK